MTTQFGFTSYTISQFESWIASVSIARTIKFVQQHHTWIPNYSHFNGSNHFARQRAMKKHHVSVNGWTDIGQHFTIFPDGLILTGRPLNRTPACIYGNNRYAICIENLGDFDVGKDSMNSAQRDSIIRVTAALLKRFSMIRKDDSGIVYHHWFDLNTGARTNGAGNTKSCPGTGFFGGNDVGDFNANFLPKVLGALGGTTPSPAPAPTPLPGVTKYVAVDADFLNIRTGPKSSFPLISEHGPAEDGSILRVYDEDSNWYKVSKTKQHWVYGRYTYDVTLGRINTDGTNCRMGPGTGYPVIAVYNTGDQVFVHETDGSWSRVGSDIWIHSSLID